MHSYQNCIQTHILYSSIVNTIKWIVFRNPWAHNPLSLNRRGFDGNIRMETFSYFLPSSHSLSPYLVWHWVYVKFGSPDNTRTHTHTHSPNQNDINIYERVGSFFLSWHHHEPSTTPQCDRFMIENDIILFNWEAYLRVFLWDWEIIKGNNTGGVWMSEIPSFKFFYSNH